MAKLVDLRSDFLSRPTPDMIEAMNRAAKEPCCFGLRESPLQKRLEELSAEILGKEDALFFPTCTMCNQTAINIHCSPGDKFIAESESHCVLSEAGAPAALSGVMARLVPGRRGLMDMDLLEAAFDPGDDLRSKTSLMVLENSHNRAGGAVLSESQIRAQCDLARVHGVAVHLDGARIFNAAVALRVPVQNLTRHVDSVAVSLNKGLSAPLGAVLAGEKGFIFEAVRVRQRLGGGWRPTDILAAAGIVALERMVDRLAEDHARARRLAEGIADCSGIGLDLETVQTNIILANFNHPRYHIQEFIKRLAAENILVIQFGQQTLRMALHWEIDDSKIDRAIEVFRRITES